MQFQLLQSIQHLISAMPISIIKSVKASSKVSKVYFPTSLICCLIPDSFPITNSSLACPDVNVNACVLRHEAEIAILCFLDIKRMFLH